MQTTCPIGHITQNLSEFTETTPDYVVCATCLGMDTAKTSAHQTCDHCGQEAPETAGTMITAPNATGEPTNVLWLCGTCYPVTQS